VKIVRYADDFVMGFEKVADARQMMFDLKERLAGLGLQLHEGKTRLIELGRFAASSRKARGDQRPVNLCLPRVPTTVCGLGTAASW
jgi:hypothetical protein